VEKKGGEGKQEVFLTYWSVLIGMVVTKKDEGNQK